MTAPCATSRRPLDWRRSDGLLFRPFDPGTDTVHRCYAAHYAAIDARKPVAADPAGAIDPMGAA